MSDKQLKKKKPADPKQATRRGIILIAGLAVMILVVNLITASYSWFSPGRTTGSGASYQDVVKTRSEQCTFKTYLGRKTAHYVEADEATYLAGADKDFRHDTIVYSGSEITGPLSDSIDVGETVYFKTDIVNPDHQFPSVVSLYKLNMPGNVKICVNNPSNSVREVSDTVNDYYIIRNAYVKVYEVNDADGPGLLTVEWSVTNTGSSAISGFDVSPIVSGDTAGLYLMYN
jgi:hypothetical protein